MNSNKIGRWRSGNESVPSPSMSLNKLREKIKQLDRIDLEHVDIDYLSSKLKDIHHQIPTRTWGTAVGSSYYRVRKNPPSKPTHIKELTFPPANCVTGYQRCNSPNEPMLYASSCPSVAISEVSAKIGTMIYLSEWKVRRSFSINHTMLPRLNDPNASISIREEFLGKFLRRKFSECINQNFSHNYKLTAAMSAHLTTNYPEHAGRNIEGDGLVGLVYPSVADQSSKDNLALPPIIADRTLELVNVIEARVVSVENQQYRLKIIDVSRAVNSQKIEWGGKMLSERLGLVKYAGFPDEYELRN